MKVLFTKSALSAGVGDFLYLFPEHSSTSVALKNDEHKQGLRGGRLWLCDCTRLQGARSLGRCQVHEGGVRLQRTAADRCDVPFVNPPYFAGPLCFLCSCPGVAAAGTWEGRRQGPGGCCVCADDSM